MTNVRLGKFVSKVWPQGQSLSMSVYRIYHSASVILAFLTYVQWVQLWFHVTTPNVRHRVRQARYSKHSGLVGMLVLPG